MSANENGPDRAFDYVADPTLLNPATPREVSAFVTQVGYSFMQAHTIAGHIGMAERMPEASIAPFDLAVMKTLPHLRHWVSGSIQYSPAMALGWGEDSPDPDEYGLVSPASVGVSFQGEPYGLRHSRIERHYTLVPSLTDEQVMVHTNSAEINPDELREYSKAEIDRAMGSLGSADESLAKEEAALAALGLRPDIITRLEILELGILASKSIRPETVAIDLSGHEQ